MSNKTLIPLFLILLFVNVQSIHAQEICDNGIDDDMDGLIDLKDTVDCFCVLDSIVAEPLSLIRNPSFEEKECCPQNFSQMSCAKYWSQASKATSDYFNSCGFLNVTNFNLSNAPQKDMHGEGFVGYINGGKNKPEYKEYVGSCLIKPMLKGEAYQFNYSIAHSGGSTSTKVALFGSASCSNLPFGGTNTSYGCPTNGPGWILLDEITIDLDTSKWNKASFQFMPNMDINTIVIGPSCEPEKHFMEVYNYYFLDNLILNTKGSFSSVKDTGSQCSGDLTLFAGDKQNSTSYQWYKNGIALVGETDSTYSVPLDSFGNYTIRLMNGSDCITKSKKIKQIIRLDLNLGRDTTICTENTFSLSAPKHNNNFQWNDGSTDSIKTISKSGTYWLEATNECGTKRDSIHVKVESCNPYIVNVFTPGKDGFNDLFHIEQKFAEPIEGKILNRWGQEVYSFHWPEDEFWNGNVQNKQEECPDGTYFYVLYFTKTKLNVNGVITLLRE